MVNLEKKIEEIKNKSGLMLALLFMLLIGAGPAVAKAGPGDNKEKAPIEKKKKGTSKRNNSGKFIVTWYFNSDLTGDIADGTKWQTSDPGKTGCGPSNLALPCSLNVPNTVTTQTQLDAYFTSQYGDDANAIKTAANSRRAAP